MASKQGKEHSSYKNGITTYRKTAYTYYEKKCFTCKSKKNIEIHHKDFNRKNNEIENLVPLCCSCHMKLHNFYIEKVIKIISFDEAIEAVKAKK